jgi:hypothetical protein
VRLAAASSRTRAEKVSVSARAVTIAPHAQDWLASTTTAVALHVFPHAAYLGNESDDVMALTTEVLGPGPLTVVVSGLPGTFDELLDAAETIRVDRRALTAGRFRVDLRRADRSQPRPAWEALRGNLSRLSGLGPLLARSALEAAPPGSLAVLLHADRALPGSAKLEDRFLIVAAAASAALMEALRGLTREAKAESLPALVSAASRLAGLGPGFTPAGDDFLLGVMYALWSTLPAPQAGAISASLAQTAAPRTTRVSAAWLRAGALGQAGNSWHGLVAGLLGDDGPAIESAISRLARVGHTSGSDALAGYLLGLRAGLDPD